MPKNRSIVILAISLAVLLGTECGIPFPSRTNAPAPRPIQQPSYRYRFVLPENYIGWVQIDVGVPKAEPWEFEQGTLTATIPESGVTQTKSALHSAAEVRLYYLHAGELENVPDNMNLHFVTANGVLVPGKWGRYGLKKGTWYFFVGPPSLRVRYSGILLPSSHASVPTPGRMTAPPNTQPPSEPN